MKPSFEPSLFTMTMLARLGGSVVVVTVVVVESGTVVVDVSGMVVVPWHGHVSVTSLPTARLRQRSASVAVAGSDPLGAQMQAGEQVTAETAVRRMYRQSLAAGSAPPLEGWLQSPWSASAAFPPHACRRKISSMKAEAATTHATSTATCTAETAAPGTATLAIPSCDVRAQAARGGIRYSVIAKVR